MKALKFNALMLTLFTILSGPVYGKIETVLGIPVAQNSNLAGSIPEVHAPEVILSRQQYVVSYNKEKRVPNWVAWTVEEKNLGNSGRSASFATDSELDEYLKTDSPSYRAVEPAEYTDSCMDRGHQTPSADRSKTLEDNKETFLMSNIAPQTPYLNRVIWAHLEIHTRELIRDQNKKAYIVTGPIYDEDYGTIGPNRDIAVPSKFFKVIVILDRQQGWKATDRNAQTIAVIMPNKDRDGSKPNIGKSAGSCKPFESKDEDMKDWEKYKVDIKDIEKAAHITLFSNL